MQNCILKKQQTFKPTDFQTNKLSYNKLTNQQTVKPTNFQPKKLSNQQTFKTTKFQTNKLLTSILVNWHTFNLIDFQIDKLSMWYSFWIDILANWHNLKLIDVKMDIIQNQRIFKVTANLLTSKLVSFQMGIFTNLQALELFSSLTNFFQKNIFFYFDLYS